MVVYLKEQGTRDKPAIFNTDQGSRFTSDAFMKVLLRKGIERQTAAIEATSAV